MLTFRLLSTQSKARAVYIGVTLERTILDILNICHLISTGVFRRITINSTNDVCLIEILGVLSIGDVWNE